MEPKYKKMYKDSPHIATDDEGKKYIKKGPSEAEKETARTSDGTEGTPINENGLPAHVRHAQERRDMNNRHETDHAVMEGKDKKEMQARHLKELSDMHKRHEKDGGDVIKKVEKKEKE